ncbi:hypothetical protein L210DRAFT_2812883 [Boletus edulis BED1]|uniref:Uncharacterized protein n=1 Tax=Boletus edulis BED1 TaxID=1328754 RepID=A0AAD4C398_BOLED|nr:hypothetical protein L210DRAFT_2812883 [Boletus edulis BED1]
MKSYLTSLAYFAAAVAAGHPSLLINTPSDVIECKPLLIAWCGGKGTHSAGFHDACEGLTTSPPSPLHP